MHATDNSTSMGDVAFDGHRDVKVTAKDGKYSFELSIGTMSGVGIHTIESKDGKITNLNETKALEGHATNLTFDATTLDEYLIGFTMMLANGSKQDARFTFDWDNAVKQDDGSGEEVNSPLDFNSTYEVEVMVCQENMGNDAYYNDYKMGDWFFRDSSIATNQKGDAEITIQFGIGWNSDYDDCKFTDFKLYTDSTKTTEIPVDFKSYPNASGWGAITGEATFTLPYIDLTAGNNRYYATGTAYNIEGGANTLIGNNLPLELRIDWDTLNKTGSLTPEPEETKVANPTYDEFETVFTGSTYAKFYTKTSGATIRYTTDGSEPSKTNGTVYNPMNASDAEYDGIAVSETTTFKIIAYKDGLQDSDIVTVTYTKKDRLKDCTFTPTARNFEGEIQVSIENDVADAEIYYILLDSEFDIPTEVSKENGTKYTGAFTINKNTYVRAIAYHDDYNTSFPTTKAWELVKENVSLDKSSKYEVEVHVTEPETSSDDHSWHNLGGHYIKHAEIETDENGNSTMTVYFENGYDKIFANSWSDSQFSSFKVYTDETRSTEVISQFENITKSGNDYIDTWFTPVAKVSFELPYIDAIGYYHAKGTMINTEANNAVLGEINTQVRVVWDTLEKVSGSGDGVVGNVEAPTFSDTSGNPIKTGQITDILDLVIESETHGAEIYYLIDNADIPNETPNINNATKYENPIRIKSTSNIKAVAYKDGKYSEPSILQIGWAGKDNILSNIVGVEYSESNAYYNAVTLKIDDYFYKEVLDRDIPLPVSDYYITVSQNGKSERHVYNGGIGGFNIDFDKTNNDGAITLMLDKNKWNANQEISISISIYDSASNSNIKYNNKVITTTLNDISNTLIQTDIADVSAERIPIDELANGKTYTSEFLALSADNPDNISMLNDFFSRKVKIVVDNNGGMVATFRNTEFPDELLDFAIKGGDGAWKSAIQDGTRTEVIEKGEVVAVDYSIPIDEAGVSMTTGVNVSMMGGSSQIVGEYDRYTPVVVAFSFDAVEDFGGFSQETDLTDLKIRNRILIATGGIDADNDGYVSDTDLANFSSTNFHISTSEDTILDTYSVYDDNRITDFSWLQYLPKQNVTSLEIGGHRIGKVSDELKGFTNLTNLDLSSNMIANIEDNAFSDLEKLQTIWITSNLISEINANTFKGLKSLTEFSLTNNAIKNIPANAFSDMSKITSIGFMNNGVETIEDGAFNGLDSARYIFATNNNITELPNNLSSLPNLMYLKFGYNKIEEIGSKLSNLPKIYEIDLEYNRIKDG